MFFKLFGTSANWNQTELKPNSSNKEFKFAANSLVDVELDGPLIGDIKKVKIWVIVLLLLLLL